MKHSSMVKRARSRTHSNSQDVELNLAPIIDAFVVLISFLLTSASFISIGVIEAGVNSASAISTDDTPVKATATVEIKENSDLLFIVEGDETPREENSIVLGPNQFESYRLQLKAFKERFPENKSITVQAQNRVPYETLVKVIEKTRETIPNVFFGGI